LIIGVARNLAAALLRPEGPKFEAEGGQWGRVLGEGQRTPYLPANGFGECYKLSQWGFGAPSENAFWMH